MRCFADKNHMTRFLVLVFSGLLLAFLALAIWPTVWLALLAMCATGACGWLAIQRARQLDRRIDFLVGTLDAVPQPLSVTDLNMNWVFINKTTESLLNKTRDGVRGRHCSEFGAPICKTQKCGVNGLRGGCPQTKFMHKAGDGTERAMQVDTNYIKDGRGQRIGHVEIITDVQAQNELSALHSHLTSSLEQMSATMTEIEAQTQGNAGSAAQARDAAAESSRCIEGGISEMEQLNRAMDAISESSREIAKINKAIDEIAFQTNILALNAAVEAARAGEAGAGFAVVADEVRNLASRAAEASHRANEVIGRSGEAVTQGTALAHKVIASLGGVGSNAHHVDSVVQQIAKACAEQVQGISDVTRTLAQLGQSSTRGAGREQSQLVHIS
jgi:methyl-accepting chemotaxis protein